MMDQHDYRPTAAQREIIGKNQHLYLLDVLPDGDLLVGDTDDRGYGPYVVTRDGRVQSIYHHYHTYHRPNRPA